MRHIDAFNHFFPKRYYEALLETPAAAKDLGKRVRGIPALSDLELRLRIVDQFENYSQVLSHGLPPMERLWGPDKSPEMAKIGNDGLAEVQATLERARTDARDIVAEAYRVANAAAASSFPHATWLRVSSPGSCLLRSALATLCPSRHRPCSCRKLRASRRT